MGAGYIAGVEGGSSPGQGSGTGILGVLLA